MKQKPIFAVPLLLLALSGCATANKAATDLWNWDITKKGQAEQPVQGRVAPLVIPPDFALKPSATAAPRSEAGSQDQVLDALFGGAAPRSATERAVVNSAGNAEAGIRSSVGDPQTVTVNKGSSTRDIVAAPEGDGQNAQAAIPQN